MSVFDEIAETIIVTRRQKSSTQEKLALECEMSVSYLRLIEHGDANPTINELLKIAKVLNIKLQNPFGLEDAV